MRKLLFIALLTSTASGSRAADPINLDTLLNQAELANPGLRSARESWQSSVARITASAAWPDPTLWFAREKEPSGMDGLESEPKRKLGVEQMIPFPGKPTLDSRIKETEARSARARYDMLRLELRQQVKERYFQLHLTERSLELADGSIAILQSLLRSAQARLASGQVSTSDVFMMQAELRRMENMRFQQTQERLKIQADLNRLLSQPSETALGKAAAPDLKDPPADLRALTARGMENNPERQMGLADQGRGEAMRRRARMGFVPDLGVMAERLTMDQGPAGSQIGVSVVFPLWLHKPWAELKSASAEANQMESAAAEIANRIERDIHAAWLEWNTHLTMARNYETGILPATQSSLTIVRQQYASGKTDLLRFLEAFRTWINAHLEYEQELYLYGRAASDLERAVGVDVSRLETKP